MAGPRPKKRRNLIGKGVAPYLFLAPFALLFLAFLIAPMVYAFNLAIYRTTVVAGTKFVGADNFIRALGDPKFWQGVVVLLKFAVIQIPGMVAVALLIALILDSGTVYLKSFFRVSLFLPYAVPAVIATLIWGYLYGPAFGPFTQFANMLHLPAPDFLSASTVLPSIANIANWEYTGYQMIIYYAALQAIPGDLEEAASMDGANGFTYAVKVKLPLIAPMVVVTIIFSIIGSLQLFSEPYLLHNIAPAQITNYYTPNYYAYSLAFSNQQYNYSAAVSFVLGAVTAVISYVFMLVVNRGSRA
ncbi:MAG: sugar ABC transporter permease [Rhizobiaceae bacterium]|nr:sugar ABC transporter permease [Rhizobiaceae bacterium]